MSQSTLKVQPNRTSKIEALLQEVEQIPDEHLGNLVQIVRLFRESTTTPPTSSAWDKAMEEINNADEEQRLARSQALSEVFQLWEDDDDEAEQIETWTYLQKALEDNP